MIELGTPNHLSVMNPPTTTEPVTPAIAVINAALDRVNEVIVKNDQSLVQLQNSLQNVTAQKIAYQAQKTMLEELKAKISSEERRK